MANPTSRQELGQYCLRALGAPVLEVNVSEEQVDDRIDFALKTWWDYHFDGSEKCYYKYQIQSKDLPGSLSEIEVAEPGIGYSNTDTVVITANTADGHGSGGVGSIITDGNGSIVSVTVSSHGGGYMNPPGVSIITSTGTDAYLAGYNGGYIKLPENIIGAINIFDITSGAFGGSADMFNIQYQIALNDLYNMTSVSVVPYYSARVQLAQMAELFVGKQPIRYNRHRNRAYIDMDWAKAANGLLVLEAYEIVDPDTFHDAWNDRWLMQYTTAQIKKQWGNNLKKYQGMRLPGNVTFSGQQIYDEAETEIKELEQRMIIDYGYPVTDMIG